MTRYLFAILLLFILSGCGSIMINPRSCNSPGTFGQEIADYDQRVTKEYYAFFIDREVKLKEIIDCRKVSSIKVGITKKMFFKYIVDIQFKDEILAKD